MPEPEDARREPRAQAEAEKAANALPDEHLVELVDVCRKEADDATIQDRAAWVRYYELWEGKRDWKGKEDWQSQISIEKPFTAIEQATAQIQRALLDSPNFLTASGSSDDELLTVSFWEDYIREALRLVSFVPKFTDACQMALITGISSYLKPRWVERMVYGPDGKPTRQAFLQLTLVMPWRIFRDPLSRPRDIWSGGYIIHEDWVDGTGFRQNKNFVEIDKAIAEGAASVDPRKEPDLRDSLMETARHKFRKPILAQEFWGDILNENGDVVLPDALMMKAGRTVIRRPKMNPTWSIDPNTGRRRWPLVSFSPFTYPTHFEGRGIIQQAWAIYKLYENILNHGVDGLSWTIDKPVEVDTSKLVNKLDTDHFPGKVWMKKEGMAGRAIEVADTGTVNIEQLIALLSYIEQTGQNVSFVSDFVIGLPGFRQDITKGEVQIKTAQSLAIFDRMGRSIEHGGQQFAELVYDMLVQFTDELTMPVIGTALPFEKVMRLAMASPMDRWRRMRADMQIGFVGVTQALQRSELLGRIGQLAALAERPLFAGRIKDPSRLLQSIIDILGLKDRVEVVSAPPSAVAGAVPEAPAPVVEAPRVPSVTDFMTGRRGTAATPGLEVRSG